MDEVLLGAPAGGAANVPRLPLLGEHLNGLMVDEGLLGAPAGGLENVLRLRLLGEHLNGLLVGEVLRGAPAGGHKGACAWTEALRMPPSQDTQDW